jgi:hypothetical protein
MARGNSRAESEYANPFGAAKYAKGEEPKTGGFSANDLKYGSDAMMKTIGPNASRTQIDDTIARGEMYANQDEAASQREKAVFDTAKDFASKAKSLLADFTIDGRYKGKGQKKVFEAVSRETGQVVGEYELEPAIAAIRELQQLADKSYSIGNIWTDDQARIDSKAIMSPEARSRAIQEDNREYYTSPGGLSSIIVAGRRQDINEAASLGAGLRAGGMTEGDLKKISILVRKGNQDRELDRYIRDKDNAGDYNIGFRVRK